MKPPQLPGYFSYSKLRFKLNTNGTLSANTLRSRPKSPTNDKDNDFPGKIITNRVIDTISSYRKEVHLKMDEIYLGLVNSARGKSKDSPDKREDSPELTNRSNKSRSSNIGKFVDRVTEAHENSLKKDITYIDSIIKDRPTRLLSEEAPDSPDQDDKIRELYLDKLEYAIQSAEAYPLDSSRNKSPSKSRNNSITEKRTNPRLGRVDSSPGLGSYSTPPRGSHRKKESRGDSSALFPVKISARNSQTSAEGQFKRAFEGLSVTKLKGQPLHFKSEERETQIDEELKAVVLRRSIFDFLIGFEISNQAWVDELAAELVKQTNTELERVFISYLWICMNLELETRERLGTKKSNNDIVKSALVTRKTTSKGFALCFEYLCREMGTSADVVKGLTKLGYLDQTFHLEITEHYWNIVKLYERYYLVDCTLGAGYLENGKFVPYLELGYFLALPEYFIFRHFPDLPEYQLIEPSISREEFERAAFVGDGFYKCKLLPNFPMNYLCEARDGLIFEFLCPKEIAMIATVEYKGKKVPNSSITTRRGNTATIVIVFRKPGYYTVELFVKKPEAKKFSTALRYLVDAKISDLSRAQQKMIIPKIYSLFYELGISLLEPIINAFNNGGSVTFRVGSDCKDLESIACIHGKKEKWTYFTFGSNKIWEVTLKNVQKPIHIAVKLANSNKFKDILSYD